jgi:hypothetical protein
MYSGTFTPKNSTTARKPGNDMKKNASIAKMGDSPAAWQKADKALGFNGQDNGSSQKNSAQKGAANPSAGFGNPDSIQMRQAPNRMGNLADQKNNPRVAPCQTGGSMNGFANPDMINVGAGPRTAGGTRAWAPSAGQNFKGNPDKIQDRQQYNNKGNKD